MGMFAWLIIFSLVWAAVARILRRPVDGPLDVGRRAMIGARTVGNTFLGSAGGQSLPELEVPGDRLEPSGENVLRTSPPLEDTSL